MIFVQQGQCKVMTRGLEIYEKQQQKQKKDRFSDCMQFYKLCHVYNLTQLYTKIILTFTQVRLSTCQQQPLFNIEVTNLLSHLSMILIPECKHHKLSGYMIHNKTLYLG